MAIEFRTDANGQFGSFDTDLNAFVVTCEGCDEVAGKGATLDEANDDAYDNDAYRDNHPEGSGDLYCRPCVDHYQDEAMRDAMAHLPTYLAEQALRDQQTREDDFLAQADAAYDAARDRGEI